MNFIDYIHQKTLIDNETLKALDTLFIPKQYKKYSYLLKAGSPSKEVFYIEEGIMRQFYTKEEKDITHAFYMENDFYMPVENIYFHHIIFTVLTVQTLQHYFHYIYFSVS